MIITSITSRNAKYFGEDVFAYWKSGKAGRTLFGLLDDLEQPVGAAVLDRGSDTADIRYFAIADAFRGRGYGRFFLNALDEALDKHIVAGLSFAMYVEEGESRPQVFDFFEHCGFSVSEGGAKRSVYELGKVVAAAPFGKGELPKKTKLIRGAMADGALREQVRKIAARISTGQSFLDGERILSAENRYGGIMIKGDEISCMLSVVSFLDSVRIEGMYSDGKGFGEMMYLFDYAIEAVRMEEPMPKYLYVDTAVGKLLQFEDTFMKKNQIKLEKRLVSVIATRRR